jgi:hypothetical protein
MTSARAADTQDAARFIRWAIYTQLGSIAVGVLVAYLPTETSAIAELGFVAGFFWVTISAYVYPLVIFGWIIECGRPISERLCVLLAGAILAYVQTRVGNWDESETGTQLVLTRWGRPVVAFRHAQTSQSDARGIGVPRAESVGGRTAVVSQGGGLRGLRADHDRVARATTAAHFGVVPPAYALALRRVAARGGGGDGVFSLAGAHACHAVARGARDGRPGAFVPRAVQEFPGRGRRAFPMVVPLCGAECADGRGGGLRGAVALGQPVGAASGRRPLEGVAERLADGTSQEVGEAGERPPDGDGNGAHSDVHCQEPPPVETRNGKTIRPKNSGCCTRYAAKVAPRH